jgi:hypothetical protein
MLIHTKRPSGEARGKPLPKLALKEKPGTTLTIPQQARGCGIGRDVLFNAAFSNAYPQQRSEAYRDIDLTIWRFSTYPRSSSPQRPNNPERNFLCREEGGAGVTDSPPP